MLPFSQTYPFFAYFKSLIKISKGFKKWNCFGKTGLNMSLKVWIVGYLNERCWFLWNFRNSFWPDPVLRVTAFFFGSNVYLDVLLDPWQQYFLILTNFSWSCLQPCSMTDAIRLPGTAPVPFAHNVICSVDVPPGHQRDRKKSENSISVCKTLLLSLTSTIVSSTVNRMSLNC